MRLKMYKKFQIHICEFICLEVLVMSKIRLVVTHDIILVNTVLLVICSYKLIRISGLTFFGKKLYGNLDYPTLWQHAFRLRWLVTQHFQWIPFLFSELDDLRMTFQSFLSHMYENMGKISPENIFPEKILFEY